MNAFEPLVRLLPAGWRPPLVASLTSSESAVRLASLLDLDVGEILSLRLGPRLHYRPLAIAKPDGRQRRVLAPSPALKRLQRRLLDNDLARIPAHPCATAFGPGSSIVRNARPHARSTLVATVDLRDFFESTRAARVRAFFAGQGWRGQELRTLMRLCVYRDGLPQGAPTSPCLSNLVNVGLDERLARLCQRTGAIYTRYGDDLTFSWASGRLPDGFRSAVEDHLSWAGYEVQPRKGWRVAPVASRPRVTGLVLRGGGRIGVPWSLRRRIWWLRRWSWLTADAGLRARLRGYEGFLRMLD
jgi:hypothetical protein